MVVGVSVGVCMCWFVVDACLWAVVFTSNNMFVQTLSICSCTNFVFMYSLCPLLTTIIVLTAPLFPLPVSICSYTNLVYMYQVCIFTPPFFPLQSVCTCSMTTGGEMSPEYVYMQPTVTEQVSVV